MRVRMSAGGHVMPLVRIETDAGVYGIGECHHDVTGLGAKDAVLNGFRQILVGQDPLDIERLWRQMMFRVSYLGGNGGRRADFPSSGRQGRDRADARGGGQAANAADQRRD